MRLAEKRKVVEVLLCAADGDQIVSLVAWALYGGKIMQAAVAEHSKISFKSWSYEDEALEAAYRLIESSLTLIGEWFGR